MKTTTILQSLAAVLLLTLGMGDAMAADFSHMDCAQILERWATNPRSVPKRLVDECKAQAESVVPVAPLAAAAAAAPATTDPCAGPGAAQSVLCWGPWATLAPAAAAAAPSLPPAPAVIDECGSLSRLATRCEPQLTAVEPLGACSPGAPCGFATVVAGVTSSAPADDTKIVRFDLAPDGSHFTVDPAGAGEIRSVDGMTPTFTHDRPPPYGDVRSVGASGDEASRIVARVVQAEDGSITQAADVWTHGNRATNIANSGYFAWGYASTQATLDSLNAVAVSVNFAGPMSVDNSTNAQITVNFGSQPAWTGTWTNPAWSFGAGGTVQGVNLNSSASQFTSNVGSGSYVQGVLLGSAGSQGLAHAIDVTLTGTGRVRDVGLLQQVTTTQPTAIHP